MRVTLQTGRSSIKQALAAVTLALLSLSTTASAQTVPPAGIVFRNSNLIMGYVSPTQSADVQGYPNCVTSMGN